MDIIRYRDDRKWCGFHPSELVIGVCALCLNERLLVIASKQSRTHHTNNRIYGISPKRSLPKIFALTSLLNRLDIIEHQKSEVYESSSTSPEDSFISIKLEETGVASWDKGKASKNTPFDDQISSNKINHHDKSKKIKTTNVIEQTRLRAALSMSWRKRIGHLFQLIKWNRKKKKKKRPITNKGDIYHVGTKLEGSSSSCSKIKYGWITNMTNKIRTKESREL